MTITARTAALMMLAVRIILYILCSASLMMFFEYPCVGLYPEDADSRCNSDFQRFHLAFYYVICTFSTVGYGDMVGGPRMRSWLCLRVRAALAAVLRS